MATLSRKAMISVLTSIQNSPEHWDRDILTFSAFLDDAELGKHVIDNFKVLGEESRRYALAAAHRAMNSQPEQAAA